MASTVAAANASEAPAAVATLFSRAFVTTGSTPIAMLGTAFAVVFASLLILDRLIAAPVDPREPPVFKSSLPVIGHWISINTQFPYVYKKIAKRSGQPICTLPVLNKKIYVINTSPAIQAGMRNKLLTLANHKAEIAKSLGQSPEVIHRLMEGTADEEIYKVTISSLTGENLVNLNKMALSYISDYLNAVEPGSPVEIDNLFSWSRDLIGIATTWGLYGKNNPYRERELVHCIWDFEAGTNWMSYGWLSRTLLAPKAMAARLRMDEAQRAYYRAEHDLGADVSAITRDRGRFWRAFGFDNDGLGRVDFMPFSATVNTAPTFFWVLAEVFADPARLARVRDEVASSGVLRVVSAGAAGAAAADDGKERRLGSIDFMGVTKHCPYAVACYREVLRLYDNATGSRTVVGADTTVTDPGTGRAYLLRAGVEVQWSAYVAHGEGQWGADPHRFRPERWLEAPLEAHRDRRDAFIPFGGGKHLCPGRNFAFAEIVGALACMAVGFELEGVRVPSGSRLNNFHVALRYPVYDRRSSPAARLVRRSGWEDVEWSFV